MWVSLLASHDPAGGNNPAYATITWGASNSVSLDWGLTASLSLTNERTIITAQIPANEAVLFTLSVNDEFSSATVASQVEIASALMHISPNGVGIGMYTLGTRSNPQLDVGYPMHARAGIAGVTIYSTDEQETGGIWLDGRPIYRKTISLGAISQGQRKVYSTGITSGRFGKLIRLWGAARVADNYIWNPIPQVDHTDPNCTLKVEIDNVNAIPQVVIFVGPNRNIAEGYVTIEYTKNTN